jgi:hypothetical protein
VPIGQLHVLKITDFDVAGVVLGHLETDECPYGVAGRMRWQVVSSDGVDDDCLGVLVGTIVNCRVAEHCADRNRVRHDHDKPTFTIAGVGRGQVRVFTADEMGTGDLRGLVVPRHKRYL